MKIELVTVTPDIAYATYVGVFALASIACFFAISKARYIEHADTRRGLIALLITSGAWAGSHVGYLVASSNTAQYAWFVLGLVFGIAAVGPWLYFCSAYTGRTLHRRRSLQYLALGIFVVIVVVKVTNPLHSLYFTTELSAVPFEHLQINHGAVHWTTMGLAYALAFVGIFMLFELFDQVNVDTTPLLVLVGITGLPVIFDVAGAMSPVLVDTTHAPIGVAIFAVGAMFLYVEQFVTVQLTAREEDPVIIVDHDGRIQEFNLPANYQFIDHLDHRALNQPIEDVLPRVAGSIESEETILTAEDGSSTRYYRVTVHPFGVGSTQLGRSIHLEDVTEEERYRAELERQNERLNRFASIVSHDLRNPLTVAQGHMEFIRNEEHPEEAIDIVEEAHERMASLIEEVLDLARHGQPVDEPKPVSLRSIAEASWRLVEQADATLSIDDDVDFLADESRVKQLFENLFRNAIDHAGEAVSITVGTLDSQNGIYIEDDGPGIDTTVHDNLFEYGVTTAEGGTGFGLAIVKEIVMAHGWEITVTTGENGGARFEITNMTIVS